MRVLLDVNIMASAAVAPGGPPANIVDTLIESSHIIIMSPAMHEKLRSVLNRPYFSVRLSEETRDQIVDRYKRVASFDDPDPSIEGFADDDEDDRVLGTAVAGKVDVIVPADRGLLALHPFRGIAIVTAREFLDLIDL